VIGATSNLDERIKQLCAEALSASDSDMSAIISELRSLIRESLLDAENLAAAAFLQHEKDERF